MNIKRAKQEIENSVKAYLSKNERGEYMIPAVRQRPVLLMGPPGIGKTAIMEQVAKDCGVALVAYTITHHTRQSAVGLPYIESRFWDKEKYSVTEYTMSEIIATVYDKMRQTGLKEGILFIDEINCVSETLAPTILQFLQCKTFGNHKVPEGWIIVAAGNPPEYNKSVREFDVVTLDRVKRIDVQADYEVWKEYAYKAQIHGAIISYLDLKKSSFYDVRTTIDGKIFVTARGWEDLSGMIKAYEKLGLKVDEEFISEYLQHPDIARDFANYYDLYNKYNSDYRIEDILEGHVSAQACERVRLAPFDEKYSIISHIISGLSDYFSNSDYQTMYISEIYNMLKEVKKIHEKSSENLRSDIGSITGHVQEKYDAQLAAGIISGLESSAVNNALLFMNNMALQMEFSDVIDAFNELKAHREEVLEKASQVLENAFDFMLNAFGEGQELVMFVTELSLNYHAIRFINEQGCARYSFYMSKYLSGDRQRELMEEIESVKNE